MTVVGSERPVILEHPPVYEPPDRSGILKLAGSVLVMAILLVAVLTNRQPQKQQSAPAAQPTPAPSMQPVPTPAHPAIQPPVQQTRPLQKPAPKAELVRMPPPRAQLVRAPFWQPGQARILRMLYDESFEVRGVLKGCLTDESLLPRSGNAIGDTWIVGHTPWVWVTVPGTTGPTWIDL